MNIVLCTREDESRTLAHGRILCTPEEAEDYLMHYRVGGEKKGIRRWQEKSGKLTPEGYQHYAEMYGWGVRRTSEQLGHLKVPNNSSHKNLDMFGRTPETNVCYIMGGSGSGKSTVARSNKTRNTNCIHLDAYIDNTGAPKSKEFNNFLIKNRWKPTDAYNAIKQGKWDKIDEFEKLIDKFGEEQYKKNKRVICEGVQLMDDTMHPDKSYFKNKPYIILNTSAVVSTFRANNRDSIKLNMKRDIERTLRQKRIVNELKKKLAID